MRWRNCHHPQRGRATLDPANPTIVKVGASPIPHAQILEYIDENLAKDAGIDLEITEIDDYQTPNICAGRQTLDANFFQTEAYLADQIKSKGYKFEHGAGIHARAADRLLQEVRGRRRRSPRAPSWC